MRNSLLRLQVKGDRRYAEPFRSTIGYIRWVVIEEEAILHSEAFVVFCPRPSLRANGGDAHPPCMYLHLPTDFARLLCQLLHGFVQGFTAVTVLVTSALIRRRRCSGAGERC